LTSGKPDAYIVGIVSHLLGEFEVFILLAVLRLTEEAAYPPAVRDEIEQRAGRPVQRGAVYVTLDRLETKGLLTSRVATDGTEAGRPRRFYRVTAKGLRGLRRALHSVEQMRAGLEPLLDGNR
jgi:PadR family transcriptional regulator, regulatory protein PadR